VKKLYIWDHLPLKKKVDMAVFNRVYSLLQPQEIGANAVITLKKEEVAPDLDTKIGRWGARIVSFPFVCCHALYNVYLMARHRELKGPTSANLCEKTQIDYMPLPGKTFHILKHPALISKVLEEYRSNQPDGLFDPQNVRRVFVPLLRDLYPDAKIGDGDFLFTCGPKGVPHLRNPILKSVGSAVIDQHSEAISEVVEELLEEMRKNEAAGVYSEVAHTIAEKFTVAILSKVFLGKTLDFDKCGKIGKATSTALQFQMIRTFGKSTPEQEASYKEALRTLREVIQGSYGQFTTSMEDGKLTRIQQDSLLLLMYIGGSDTTTTAIIHLLWQLGRHPEMQEEPRPSSAELLKEALRLIPPADFSRQAGTDIELSVNHPGGPSWSYRISKGDTLVIPPSILGRGPSYKNADQFLPGRDLPSAPTFVFSEGRQSCPGKHLVEAEVTCLIDAILKEYRISSTPVKEELSIKRLMTTQITDEVHLNFKRR
jgi:cytochrome P450